jgi:hypothetical protein
MDSKNEHKSEALEELERAAEELESETDQREEGRFEAQREEQEDLNQGKQTGTYDPDPWLLV